MTVWFGIGLIVYVHLAILLAAFICTAETRRLRIRVKDLEAKFGEPAAGPSNQAGSGENHLDQDSGVQQPGVRQPGVQQPHVAPNRVPDSSADRSKLGELAAQGLSREQIARQTRTPRAEVDFLLKLRQLPRDKARSAASNL